MPLMKEDTPGMQTDASLRWLGRGWDGEQTCILETEK